MVPYLTLQGSISLHLIQVSLKLAHLLTLYPLHRPQIAPKTIASFLRKINRSSQNLNDILTLFHSPFINVLFFCLYGLSYVFFILLPLLPTEIQNGHTTLE